MNFLNKLFDVFNTGIGVSSNFSVVFGTGANVCIHYVDVCIKIYTRWMNCR